eukprot:scaffold1900_cov123-Cylindrotheca_fusiformis.AAC.20
MLLPPGSGTRYTIAPAPFIIAHPRRNSLNGFARILLQYVAPEKVIWRHRYAFGVQQRQILPTLVEQLKEALDDNYDDGGMHRGLDVARVRAHSL